MSSVNQAAAALRALIAPFVGGVSEKEFDRRLELLDREIDDVRLGLDDVRSLVNEFTAGSSPAAQAAADELMRAVRRWEGSE